MKEVEILIKHIVKVPDDVSDEVLTEIAEIIACTGERSPEIEQYNAEEYYDHEETFDTLQETKFESSQLKISTIHDGWVNV